MVLTNTSSGTPLEHLWSRSLELRNGSYTLFSQLLRLLIDQYEWADEDEEGEEWFLFAFPFSSGSESIVQSTSDFFFLRDRMYPSYREHAIQKRVHFTCAMRPNIPELFWLLLGQDYVDFSCFEIVTQGALHAWAPNLFCLIVDSMSILSSWSTNQRSRGIQEGWRRILRGAVEVKGYIPSLRQKFSPLLVYLNAMMLLKPENYFQAGRLVDYFDEWV